MATGSACRSSAASTTTTATAVSSSRSCPGSGPHLEFTSGGDHKAPSPHPETLLVLYLGNTQAVEGTFGRVPGEPVESANPYWQTHAVTLADPDGFRVVLVPRSWPET